MATIDEREIYEVEVEFEGVGMRFGFSPDMNIEVLNYEPDRRDYDPEVVFGVYTIRATPNDCRRLVNYLTEILPAQRWGVHRQNVGWE